MAGSLPSKGRISLPARRLSVRKIKEVLRLKFDVGLGLRAIARSWLRTPNACVEEIDYRTARGLDKSVIRP